MGGALLDINDFFFGQHLDFFKKVEQCPQIFDRFGSFNILLPYSVASR